MAWYALTTSGILYADVGFDLSGVEADDLTLLPLFARLLKEAGTKTMDELSLQRRIGSTTGGISASYFSDLKHIPGKVSNPDEALFYLMLRGKATGENVPELFNIFRDMLVESKLGDCQKKALEILKETKIRAESSVITSGHSYAATRLASQSSLPGYFSEMTGGVTYIRSLAEFIQQAESDWPTLSARLEKIRTAIVRKNGFVINLTADQDLTTTSMPSVEKFLDALPSGHAPVPFSTKWDRSKLHVARNEGFSMSSQVNYVVKSTSLFQPGEDMNGAFSVVTSYISKGLLWEKVRVMGGAYGGFARFGENSGRIIFLSYRDPNLSKTLDIYDSAADYLKSANIPEEDVIQTIIGCTGDLDTPMTADQKGFASMTRYLNGETLLDRQRHRDQVLGTTVKDFRVFADKLTKAQKEGRAVVFGSEGALEEANKVLSPESSLSISRVA